MALPPLASLSSCASLTKMLPLNMNRAFSSRAATSKSVPNAPLPRFHFQCNTSLTVATQSDAISRRSGEFEPSVWHFDYIQSLNTKYKEGSYEEERRMLKEDVRAMLSKVVNPVDQLELIETLQRLGVAYHFDSEINNILENVYNQDLERLKSKNNLYTTALAFRILRQRGYNLSAEMFSSFQDETGNFQESLCLDIKGMLALYEASYHLMQDETILEKARDFASKSLKEFVEEKQENYNELSALVNHALEIPLHWRMSRWEALWFINEYERMPNMTPTLLHFAKLDFNMIQAIHQEEMKRTTRWWDAVGLERRFSFFRSRLVDNHIWALGMKFEPNLGNFREATAKVFTLITLIDDIYDIHGTLEELELFTEAVNRWDINATVSLPYYMKMTFLALYNFVNELSFDIQREKGHNIHSYLKKVWLGLCKAYHLEAKWYHSGYIPSLQEYMENGWTSIGGALINVHAYFLIPDPIRKDDLDLLEGNPNLIYLSGYMFRLLNDFGSFKREKETGDVPSSIQCYMHESGASEEDAIEHIKSLLDKTWQKMNEEVAKGPFSRASKNIAMDLVRTAVFFYHYGDDTYTIQDPEIRNRLFSLLMDPIPIKTTKNN